MLKKYWLIWFIGCCIACQSSSSSVLDMQLPTLTEGEPFQTTMFGQNKASVLFFLAPECPLSQNYTVPIKKIQQAFQTDSIAFYGVFPGTFYSRDEITAYVKKYDLKFPVLLDREYQLTQLLGATITPEVVVLDAQGATQYQGAIDNWAYELGKKRSVITEHYLTDALTSITQGKPITTTHTKAVGCIIE